MRWGDDTRAAQTMQLDDGPRDFGPGSGDGGRTDQAGIKYKTIAKRRSEWLNLPHGG